jgi:hypothetical protein
MPTQVRVSTTPVAYSVDKFVRAFNVGRTTVYEEIRAGRLKARKAGARTLIAHEDGVAWLNSLPTRSLESTKDISCFAQSAETVFRGSDPPAAGSGTAPTSPPCQTANCDRDAMKDRRAGPVIAGA